MIPVLYGNWNGEVEDAQSFEAIAREELDGVFSVLANQEMRITWSSWQCALSRINILTEKNLTSLYNFINIKGKPTISLSALNQAYRPHIFRLKPDKG
jgi:hypothetical protein